MNSVLVLSATFEPCSIIHWQKAMGLMFQEKVEVIEEYDCVIRTVSKSFKLPSVLRLTRYIPVRKKASSIRFSRVNIFIRDRHCCQYCGRKRASGELTLDHVTPAVQDGKKSWGNIVTACIQCNQRKGGRTPQEASMKLISKPTAPAWRPPALVPIDLNSAPKHWKNYLRNNPLNPTSF